LFQNLIEFIESLTSYDKDSNSMSLQMTEMTKGVESKNVATTPSPRPTNPRDSNFRSQEIPTTNNLPSHAVLPLLKYMVLSDAIIQEHRKLLSAFLKLLLISSLAALVDGLCIEFQFTTASMTFTDYLLRTGTYAEFPMHYAIIVNGIMGLICCLVCTISLVRVVDCVGLITTTCVLCGMWTVFTLVYNFGSNILYEDQLEELMIHELQKSSASISITSIWRTSQKFFKCCGITSFKDWRFGKNEQESTAMYYPPSCCNPTKLKVGSECDENPVQESEIWLDGCLDSESVQIMIIAYTALLISTLQFLFMTFSLMALVKVLCRRRCLKKQAIAILTEETVLTMEDKNNVGVIERGDEFDKDFEIHEINKSSTM